MANKIIRTIINQTGLLTNSNPDILQPGSLQFCENVDLKKPGILTSRKGFLEFFNLIKAKKMQIAENINDDDKYVLLRNNILNNSEIFYDVVYVAGAYLAFTSGGLIEILENNLVRTPYMKNLQLASRENMDDYINYINYINYAGTLYFSIGNSEVLSYVPMGDITRDLELSFIKNGRHVARKAGFSRASHPHLPYLLEDEKGWLAPKNEVAYRVVWRKENATGLTVRGAPSTRVVVKNNNNFFSIVRFKVAIAKDVVVGDVLEIYRSASFTSLTEKEIEVGVYESADDELTMVSAIEISEKDIEDGVIEVIDNRKTSGQKILYSSPSQEGAQGENIAPPVAKALGLWNNCVAYANLKSRPLGMLAVNDLTNLKMNDTIVFSCREPFQITASDTEIISRNYFEFFLFEKNSNDEQAKKAEYLHQKKTLHSLAHVANTVEENKSLHFSVIADGERVSLLIESVIQDDDVDIYFIANDSEEILNIEDKQKIEMRLQSIFNPVVGGSFETAFSLESREHPNRIVFSKPYYPEATTLSSYLDIGGGKKKILAMHEIDSYLYVLKEDGLFRVSGADYSNAEVTVVDVAMRFVGKYSSVVFYDELFVFTKKGVMSIGYGKIINISNNINDKLREKMEWTNIHKSRLVVDATEGRLLLLLPSSPYDVYLSDVYVFHSSTNEWTRWNMPYLGVGVNEQHQLFAFDEKSLQYQSYENKPESYIDNLRTLTLAKTSFYTSSVSEKLEAPYQISEKQLGGDVLYESLEENELILAKTVEVEEDIFSITVPNIVFNKDAPVGEEEVVSALQEYYLGDKLYLVFIFPKAQDGKWFILDENIQYINNSQWKLHSLNKEFFVACVEIPVSNLYIRRWLQVQKNIKLYYAHMSKQYFIFNKLWLGERHELKSLSEIAASFNSTTYPSINLYISTDISVERNSYSVPLVSMGLGYGFGLFNYDGYGGAKGGGAFLRVSAPREKRIGKYVEIGFGTNEFSYQMEMTSFSLAYEQLEGMVF